MQTENKTRAAAALAGRFAKKTALVTGAVVLAAGGLLGAAAWAHDDDHKREHFVDKVADRLDLSDSQRRALETMAEEVHDYRGQLRDEAEEKARDAIAADDFDKDDALMLMHLRRDAREQWQEYAAERAARFHASLSPKQREEAADLLVAWRGKHGRHHRWGGWGRDRHDDDDDDDDDDY